MSGRAGLTTVELVVAMTAGLIVTGAALALCRVGNEAVARLSTSQAAWQSAQAAATLWGTEWRGAGYDPTGRADSGITRMTPETLEFSADWNGDGQLLPTESNPNERLAYAIGSKMWRRGVNGGGRILLAWPDSGGFTFRDDLGKALDFSRFSSARLAEVGLRLPGRQDADAVQVVWIIGRRNRAP